MGSLAGEFRRREAAARAEAERLRTRIEELAEDSTSPASTGDSTPALTRGNTHLMPDRPAHFRRAAPNGDGEDPAAEPACERLCRTLGSHRPG